MRLTNKFNLPQPLVNAVMNDDYDNGGTLSATTMIKPAYMKKLESDFPEAMVEDVSDRIWSLLGQAGHNILERAAGPEDIVEERYRAEVATPAGNVATISAQIDLLSNKLTDYKITSVWKIKHAIQDGEVEEWEQQMNIQDYLLGQNGKSCDGAEIMAIARDWNKSGAMRDRDYPRKVELIPIKLWDPLDQLAFIESRIDAHMSDNPPPCTDKERWAKPGTVAVMKKGQKRAMRVVPTEEEAQSWAEWKGVEIDGEKVYLDHRPPEYTRCAGYCSVSSVCPVYQEFLNEGKEDE